MHLIRLVQVRDKWRVRVKTVINLRGPKCVGNFLITRMICQLRNEYPAVWTYLVGPSPFPPSSAEVKKWWSFTFTPPVCHHDVDRQNVTFTLTFCIIHIPVINAF